MKNREILQMYNGLQLCGELKGIKFSFAVAKNNKILGRAVEPLVEEIKKLQEEYATKDAEGAPITKDNVYQIPDMVKFNAAYKELMDIDTEVVLHKIKQADLPQDISASQLSTILEFVIEE